MNKDMDVFELDRFATIHNRELIKKHILFLQKKLALAPDDIEIKYQLANKHRNMGDLDAAIELLKSVVEFCPNHQQAGRLLAVLTCKQLDLNAGSSARNNHPAEIIRIDDFLSVALHKQLLSTVVGNEINAQRSIIEAGYVPQTRKSLTIVESKFSNLAELYRKKLRDLFYQLLGQERRVKALNIEIQMNIYSDQFYYRPHRDRIKTNNRYLTAVYYFYRQPRCFSGGDLVVYDAGLDQHSSSGSFTRISPRDNSLVVFKSDYLHEVLPVKLQPDCYENSRFSLTGWLLLD